MLSKSGLRRTMRFDSAFGALDARAALPRGGTRLHERCRFSGLTATAYEIRGTLLQLLVPISDSPVATASAQLLRTMAELGRLQPVDLREVWETEAQDFTPWLAKEENLSLLADTLRMELELASQETSVGPFRADILCRNADG